MVRQSDTIVDAERWYLFVFGCILLLFFWAPLPALPCFFKILTGLPCPTCGSGRALLLLRQGDPARAFAMSPLFTGSLLLAGLGAVYALSVTLFKLPRLRPVFADKAVLLIPIVAVLANWVYLLSIRP